ncbi:hypothetical protein V8E51_019891 [Hyaloscypha variabilis]
MELPFRVQQQSISHSNRNGVEYQPKRFNVGVDFGSTYSAATFVLLSASTPMLQAGKIVNVPYRVATSHNRLHCYETPTVLRYEDICTRWGWDAKRVEESGEVLPGKFIDMIKLLLDEAEQSDESRRDELRRRVADDIRKLDKTVVDVLVDYLTPFFKHIMGYMVDQGYYDLRDKVELDCTVPAIWKEKSRRKMLAAIDKAGQMSGFGFGKAVWLVSEPEAAASYVLKMNPNWNLQEGENILLCDAGGGTVDLITYTVIQQNPLRVQEAVGGTGGLCGSNYLNSRCLEQTLQRLDNARFIDGKKSQQMKFQMAKEVTNNFEKLIKPTFQGIGDFNHSVPVPRLIASFEDEFRDDLIIFTPERLNLIFDPVIFQVWELMRSQLESSRIERLAVQKVCLVGGFGGSPRLQSYLTQIDFFVPDAPDIAIAYGATLRSMDKKNGAPRKCRSSLGIAMNELYDKNSAPHKNAEALPDKFENKKYVRDCLDWMFKLDETIPPTKTPRERALHRDVPEDQDTLVLSVTVYSSDTNRDSHYPITHQKNQDHEILEEVDFTLDMTKFRDKLIKLPFPKKSPRTRGPGRKYPQGISIQQRRSVRKRMPTAKGLDYQYVPIPQMPVLEVSSPNISSSHDTLGSSQHQPPSTPSSAPNNQEASSPPTEDETAVKYYYRVPYKFIMEVDGLIIKYRMEIPDANKCVEGEINLAHILPPGAS